MTYIRRYNAIVESKYHIPTYSRSSSTLGILIGNTKNLWPVFLDHLRHKPNWDASSDPLDVYVRESVAQIVTTALPSDLLLEVRFSDAAEKNVVVFQKVAHIAGVHLNEIVHLNVDKVFGAWIAWRAIGNYYYYHFASRQLFIMGFGGRPSWRWILSFLGAGFWLLPVSINIEGPPRMTHYIMPQNLSPESDAQLQVQMERLLSDANANGVRNNWHAWVDVRDMVSGFSKEAKQWRYSDEQIEYHYTHNINVLSKCLASYDVRAVEI